MMYVCTCSTRRDQHGLLKCLELFLTSNIRKSCCCPEKITWQREYLFEIIKTCLKTVSQTRTTVTPLLKLEPSVSLAVGLPSSSVPPRTSDNTVFFYTVKKRLKAKLKCLESHSPRKRLRFHIATRLAPSGLVQK